MKKALIYSVALVLLVGSVAFAGPRDGRKSFQAIWNAITHLRQQLSSTTWGVGLLESDVADLYLENDLVNERIDNLNTKPGTWNIRFITANSRGRYVLHNNGTVYKLSGTSWVVLNLEGYHPLPVPVDDIVQWEIPLILDKNGDVWKWNGSWINCIHPLAPPTPPPTP
jgi:hypothetical protein